MFDFHRTLDCKYILKTKELKSKLQEVEHVFHFDFGSNFRNFGYRMRDTWAISFMKRYLQENTKLYTVIHAYIWNEFKYELLTKFNLYVYLYFLSKDFNRNKLHFERLGNCQLWIPQRKKSGSLEKMNSSNFIEIFCIFIAS